MNKEILEQTERYYSEKIEQFGMTSKGVDWNSEESQRRRFEQLTKILDCEKGDQFSICDYGCGYGYYSEYLKERNYCCNYIGIDLSEKMVMCAKQRYREDESMKFLHGSEIEQTYDFIVASGIFNVRQSIDNKSWTKYVLGILEKFNQFSSKGFAFNCLTKYSDFEYMKDYLYYADPLFYFDYAKTKFSRNVALLHDYGLYEFTILVRK